MSSDEDNVSRGKRKRRPRRLPDSPASTSSGSPIIGSSAYSLRRRKVNILQESSDSESTDNSDVIVKRRKVGRVETDSDFSSDSDSSPVVWSRLSRNLTRTLSDSSHSTESMSGSDIIVRRAGIVVLSDEEDQGVTDFSDTSEELTIQKEAKPSTSIPADEKTIDSDSSDGVSEKCAICLLSFKLQEVGIPENCEHNFCLECLEEWSKNMNTCPVDRIEYHSITVKKFLNGKVVRKIPIQRPERQEDAMDIIVEDPTFCEICHSDENEDRILLCDGCDLGYHLYCLTPPLAEVPEGNWFCVHCSPRVNINIDYDEVIALMREANDVLDGSGRNGNGRRPSRRLIPRTRQSERVRQRVENNRNQRRQAQQDDVSVPSTSTGIRVSSNRVTSSNATVQTTSTTSRTTSRRKRKKKPRYKTVWVLNDLGEAVATKKRVRSRKKRKTKKTSRQKKENSAQLRPDPRAGSTCASAAVRHHRHQGGIPSLDLFGSVNVLDFTESEDEGIFNESGVSGINVALARRPSVVDGMRRTMRRKATVVGVPTVSSSTDILDSIMQSQEVLLSKSSVISVVDSSGKIVIESKNKTPALNNNSPTKPDFNSYTVKETPWHGRNYQQSGYRPHNRNNWSNNRNNWQNQNNYHNYQRQGGQNFYGQGGYGGQGRQHYQDDIPQDYTQRTLCEAELMQDGEEEQQQQQEENPPAEISTSEPEVDIYGDIETEAVSTSNKTEEDYRPPSPQPMQQSHTPNTNTDEDCDSESGMVIDTERGPDEPVSSTVALDNEPVTYSPGQPTDSPEENAEYSPGEPTGSPGEALGTENSQNVSLEHLQSGLAELQQEFASGLQEFQMNVSNSESKEEMPTSSSALQEMKQSEGGADIEAELANLVDDKGEDVSPAQSPGYRTQLKPRSRLDSTSGETNPTASVNENPLNLNSTTKHQEDYDMSDDGCPNFSIYSKESKSVALTTDLTIRDDPDDPVSDNESQKVMVEKTGSDPRLSKIPSWNLGGLYSDSEDESVVKKTTSFGISDIKDMTEDILSEEERSYTPVLDERCDKPKKGFEGLDTEMISDDDRNDFDESQELKTASDGDALEINAKESELDFTRPDEFEEGEIVDKNKDKPPVETDAVINEESTAIEKKDKENKASEKELSGKKKKKDKEVQKQSNQNSEETNKENVNKETFKKLTKSSKERNYRDKDRDKTKDSRRSRSPSNKREENKRKKEKRKELARYSVRAIIAEKPRAPPKDQFGRDIIRRSGSRSRSRSYTPPLTQKSPVRAPSPVIARRHSPSPRVRTPPRDRSPVAKRRSTSRSREKSRKRKRRSVSPGKGKRDRSKTKKRKRSTSRSNRGKKPKEKGGKKREGHRRRSASPQRRRREWTPSLSRSLTPPLRHLSPSWTPPRTEPNVLRNQNLTVIVNNDTGKKKKDKRNKEKRRKEDEEPSRRRRRDRERTPPPSKEVFASGDNILVSVSFNNDSENRDVTRENRKRKEISTVDQQKKNERREKRNKNMVGVKPVAIIDLELSPIQEIVSSPKDVIVLSDSDNNETESNRNVPGTNVMCDSSQQVASPEQVTNYSTGPKTPPEPSVKFALMPKPQQMRAINNPLHDPLEHVEEEEEEEEGQDDLNTHKGPNTPPEEPPTSPPSSPDAYDPFEPTKSRSPTPEAEVSLTVGEEHNTQGDVVDLEKPGQTPDVIKSLTPPVPDIQPADSQSSIQEISESKTPEDPRPNQQTVVTKPIAQTVPFSPATQPALAAVIPVSSTVTISRINILSSAMLTPAAQVKPSPVKISPTKAPVKSTPIKPMQSKTTKKKQQNGNNAADDTVNLDFDSPYSPGSSDYEDLFEPPPTEPTVKAKSTGAKTKATGKKSSAFDTLFGSPTYNKKGGAKKTKRPVPPNKTKHVGVKVDEDSLKILEELPNSAVEMQVKDKFLKKLNRQERVVEEVKLVLKPFYNKKKITKEEYKDIMRRAVPKICHNKSGEINPIKIRSLIEAYVKKVKHSKKVTSSSQKVV